METVYKPYRYLFALGKGLPGVTMGCSILCWLPTVIIEMLMFDHWYMPLLRLSLVANLTVLFLALLFSMALHEICGTTYTIREETFIKKSPYKTALVHFENVTQFRYVRIPLIGGFGVIRVPSGFVTLPFLIDRMDECIEDIRQNLAACGKQGVYDDRRIDWFKVKAVINGISVRRIEMTIPALFKIVIGTVAGSAFIAQFFWEMSLRWIVFWSFSGIIFPIMGYVIAETIFNLLLARKAKRNPSSALSSPSKDFFGSIDESGVYRMVGVVTAIIYVIAGIVLKNLITVP